MRNSVRTQSVVGEAVTLVSRLHSISLSLHCSPAVTADGSGLRCWGSGASGQLGTDDTLDLLSPPPSDIVFPIPSSVPLTTLLSIVIPISVCVAIAATVTVVLVRKWRKKVHHTCNLFVGVRHFPRC